MSLLYRVGFCGLMDGVRLKIETLFIAFLNPENPTMDETWKREIKKHKRVKKGTVTTILLSGFDRYIGVCIAKCIHQLLPLTHNISMCL